MDWKITPASKLFGETVAPADKSITHRAIMFAAIAEGESVIENYLPAEDCMSTVKAFQSMGVVIDRAPYTLSVNGVGLKGLKAPAGMIDAGNSGTTVRLLSGILAGQNFTATITGDESLKRRPMKRIMEPLGRMGVIVQARDGNFLPLEITGTPQVQPLEFDSPIASAQVKSCVLLAGMHADGITSFTEPIRSRDHTERMLAAAGADIRVDGLRVSIKGPSRLQPFQFKVPGDISSAAFFLVAGAIVPSSKIVIRNVGVNPTRDGIIEVLQNMGAKMKILKAVDVSGEPVADIMMETSSLKAVTLDASIMPRLIDEIPVIVLAATQARGTTVISGAQELRVKESDRLKTITAELTKMGAHIEEKPDGLIIHGPTQLRGAELTSYGDHRIAMTCAVAGLIAAGQTTVHDVACVDTSFPGFWAELQGVAR